MIERELGYSLEPAGGVQQRFEYLVLTLEPRESIKEARARIREHAEYGRWELTRSVILYGGRRRYWLRRRVMKLRRTAPIPA